MKSLFPLCRNLLLAFFSAVLFAFPGALSAAGCEDCISFNPATAQAKLVKGDWKVVSGNLWLISFGNKRAEAEECARIIRHYRMDSQCFSQRPGGGLEYMLAAGSAPSGKLAGEDCLRFDPNNLSVARSGSRWLLKEGPHQMFAFDSQAEARLACLIIQKYGFTQTCYVGRPNPSFKYLRK